MRTLSQTEVQNVNGGPLPLIGIAIVVIGAALLGGCSSSTGTSSTTDADNLATCEESLGAGDALCDRYRK